MKDFIDYTRRIIAGKRNRSGINCDVQIMLKRDFPLVINQEIDQCTTKIREYLDQAIFRMPPGFSDE